MSENVDIPRKIRKGLELPRVDGQLTRFDERRLTGEPVQVVLDGGKVGKLGGDELVVHDRTLVPLLRRLTAPR